MKTHTIRWVASLIVTALVACYFGHHWGMIQSSQAAAGIAASHTSGIIELLKTGQAEEALRIQTAYLNLQMQFIDQRYSLHSPLALIFADPWGARRRGMSSAQHLHRTYPELAFNANSLSRFQEFERRNP